MAVVLAVAAVAFLVVSAVLGSATSVWLHLLTTVVESLGISLLFLSLIWAVRRRAERWIRRILVELAGPALVSAMPPRTVLNAVLARVFGDKVGYQEVSTALLGGGGRDPGARDTAVSRGTTARIRLERIDDSSCLNEMTWTHEFSGVRNNHHYVMFATTDAEIFSLVNLERTYPLFEAWFVENDDQLESFVPGLRKGLDVGVSYTDVEGRVHEVAPRPVVGKEVALRDYDQFVKLPRWVDRQNLVIFHLDLYDLADPDHVVHSIEQLALRASAVGLFDQGFVTWSAPFPCFVDKIVFDVRRLARDRETLVYQVVAATLKGALLPLRGTWTAVSDSIDVSLESWMLPGHAVTLLWRPLNGAEPQHDPDRW